MAPSTEQLLLAALTLSAQERDELIEALIAAADSGETAPLDEKWRSVIERRSADIDAGTARTVPWTEVRDRVHKEVGLDD